MKLITFNKKVLTEKIDKIIESKAKVSKPSKAHYIPLEFFKGSGELSIENILNTLPPSIQKLLSNGNNPTSIKSNSSIIEIKTDTGLKITLKSYSITNDVPECKIYDGNTKTELLNTYKR